MPYILTSLQMTLVQDVTAQIMARLGIEPRPPEYILGALPIELLGHRYQS
jgi:hypothetical protein